MTQLKGDGALVNGKLMTIANPVFNFTPIDLLEAFGPNGRSMYQRILVVVVESKD